MQSAVLKRVMNTSMYDNKCQHYSYRDSYYVSANYTLAYLVKYTLRNIQPEDFISCQCNNAHDIITTEYRYVNQR